MRKCLIVFVWILCSWVVKAQNNVLEVDWEFVGPKDVAKDNSDSGRITPYGLGRIEAMGFGGRKNKWIYAGSNTGGLFLSKNHGKKWEFVFNVNPVCGVWDIEVDTKNKKHLWVATGNNNWAKSWGLGVLESKNGGKTWQKTGLTFEPYQQVHITSLEQNENELNSFLACSKTDVYVSNDYCVSWRKILDNDDKSRQNLRQVLWNNNQQGYLLAAGATLYFSYDSGNSWHQKRSFLTYNSQLSLNDSLPGRFAVALNPLNNNQLVVCYAHKGVSYIDRSDDFGKTWYNILKGRIFDRLDVHHTEIAWNPADTTELAVGSFRVYTAKNGTDNFRLVSFPYAKNPQFMHDDIREMIFTDDGTLWVGNDGGISKSTDLGENWTNLPTEGMRLTQFYSMVVNKGMLVAGGQDLSTFIFQNSQWRQTTEIYADGSMCLINDSMYVQSQNGAKYYFRNRSDDRIIREIYTPFMPNRFIYPVQFCPTDSSTIWVTDHDLWQLKPNGNWTNLTKTLPKINSKIVALDANDPNRKIVYLAKDEPTWSVAPAGLKHHFYKGTFNDSGFYHWQDITINLPILAWREIGDIYSNPLNNDEVYVCFEIFDDTEKPYRVYKSTDGGQSWWNISNGLPNTLAHKIELYNQQYLLLATDAGMFYMHKTDSVWTRLKGKEEFAQIIDFQIDKSDSYLYVAAYGNGVWRMKLPDVWLKKD